MRRLLRCPRSVLPRPLSCSRSTCTLGARFLSSQPHPPTNPSTDPTLIANPRKLKAKTKIKTKKDKNKKKPLIPGTLEFEARSKAVQKNTNNAVYIVLAIGAAGIVLYTVTNQNWYKRAVCIHSCLYTKQTQTLKTKEEAIPLLRKKNKRACLYSLCPHEQWTL